MTRDPLAAFHDDLLAGLRDGNPVVVRAARRHQETIRSSPGVADIVYEWRRHLGTGVVLDRTDRAFVVAVPDRVWAEFESALGAERETARGLRDLHRRQARRSLGHPLGAETEGDPMVLTRP